MRTPQSAERWLTYNALESALLQTEKFRRGHFTPKHMKTSQVSFTLVLGIALLHGACGPEGQPAGAELDPNFFSPPNAQPDSDAGSDGAGSADAGDAPLVGFNGLPCDVAGVLASYCVSCHGASLAGNAPVHLTSLDDLKALSSTEPGQTLGELSVARMRDDLQPMPPAGARVPDADVQAFETWVQAGMPAGECATSNADTAFSGPVVCTTGAHWTQGNRESPEMHPGAACIDCHTVGVGGERGPRFDIAGTLYATGHEPNDCKGVNGNVEAAKIEVTDSRGKVVVLSVNRSGNFFEEPSNLSFPITARVLYQGRSRAMLSPQMSGDCNSCHTEGGSDGAPGRIALP